MHGDLEDYSFFFKSLEITYCWNKQFLKIVWSLPYCGRVMNSITLPLPGWWIRTQASFTSCCMRIGHPNSVLFWGPTKTERWKTYTKKLLQRYTNGLHLEADAAPLTTLQRRDMFWKILLKAWELITNSGSCFIHLKTQDIQFFSVQVCKRPKLKCNYFSISSLSIAFLVHVFKTMCYIHTKKTSAKTDLMWLKIAECFEKVL